MTLSVPRWLPPTLCLMVLAGCTSTPSGGTTGSAPTSSAGAVPSAAPGSSGATGGAASTAASTGASGGPGSSGGTSGTTASGGAASTAAVVPDLSFAPCAPTRSTSADLTGFECATAEVPLDWADPTGDTISLAVVQHPATGTGDRIGTLFFNPGGPGGTATGQFVQWWDNFPPEVRDRFDIVSWDPRGIGQSTAVQCYDSPQAEGEALGAFAESPVTDVEIAPYLAAIPAIGQACGERNGALLDHVTTADTARDMEALRLAVGDDQLSYFGVSYGTYLGATYANLFPDAIRGMVLDGNLAPANWTAGGHPPTSSINDRIGSSRGITENVRAFMSLCGATTTDACAFSTGSPETTMQKWTDLLARVAERPYVSPSGGELDYQGLSDAIGNAMDIVAPQSFSPGWSGTAETLQTIWTATDPAAPSAAASTPSAAPSSAAPSAEPYDGPEQIWAVICGDQTSPPADAWPGLAQRASTLWGSTAASLVWGDAICTGWPGRAAQPYTGPWDTPTSAPLLLVGNTQDPSTPYANTLLMAQTLGRTATLTVEGYGHTALLNPSTCAAQYMSDYLIDGALPPTGALCQQDAPPFS